MDDNNNPSIPASSQPTIPDPMMTPPSQPMMETTPPVPESPTMTATPMPEAPMPEMPMPGPMTQPTASQFGGQATSTPSTTTEVSPALPTTPEVQWPGAKPKSKLPKVLGGIAAIILVVGVATAAYFVSSKVGGRQAVAPNAPVSLPQASAGCKDKAGNTKCGKNEECINNICKAIQAQEAYSCNATNCPAPNFRCSSSTNCVSTTSPGTTVANDPNNCGATGHVCASNQICQSGTCVLASLGAAGSVAVTGTPAPLVTCPNPKKCADGTTVDLCRQSCPESAGTCGTTGKVCASNQICQSGNCVLASLGATGSMGGAGGLPACNTCNYVASTGNSVCGSAFRPGSDTVTCDSKKNECNNLGGYCTAGQPTPCGTGETCMQSACGTGWVPAESGRGCFTSHGAAGICCIEQGSGGSGGTTSGGGTVAPTKKPGGGGGGGGTTTTTTTTTATGGACMELFIYQKKADGTYSTVQMTKDELSKLKIGDKLRFAVKGNKDNLKSRYMVYLNDVAQGDWLPGGPADGLFSSYSDYEIKSAGNYKFEAQVQ